jgi:hypothetical protein
MPSFSGVQCALVASALIPERSSADVRARRARGVWGAAMVWCLTLYHCLLRTSKKKTIFGRQYGTCLTEDKKRFGTFGQDLERIIPYKEMDVLIIFCVLWPIVAYQPLVCSSHHASIPTASDGNVPTPTTIATTTCHTTQQLQQQQHQQHVQAQQMQMMSVNPQLSHQMMMFKFSTNDDIDASVSSESTNDDAVNADDDCSRSFLLCC